MYSKVKDIFTQHEKFIGQSITVGGWIKTSRDKKNFLFIELNDGSFFKNLQVIVDNSVEHYDGIVKLGVGSAISVSGLVVKSPGQKQPIELRADSVVIEGSADEDYPLQKKRHSFEYLRTIAHLRPRTNTFSAVFRVRSLAAYAVHKFFNDRNFICLHSPIITASDAEGAGEMFRLTTLDAANPPRAQDGSVNFDEDFFGDKTYLTVSGQLSAENFALALRDVYTFGPTFRAENSNTARHAAEFWMIEPEMAFADLENNMQIAEEMLKYIIRYVTENAPDEIDFFNGFVDKGLKERLKLIMDTPFGVISYTEAIDELTRASKDFEYPVRWGMDLQTEHERYLTEEVFKKPVFVINYPKDIKAFYMRLNDDNKTVAAMDLLVPGIGEIIGGSQREERLDALKTRIAEFGLKEDNYWWYLDLRRYGSVKHAGFGMGFERCLMYMTGMQNIRDVIPFARTVRNADF